MIPILLALSLPATAGDYLLSTGDTHEIGSRGNWARLFQREDGGFWFLVAGAGDYTVQSLSSDLELEGGRTELTGLDYLVDHAITLCPDGTFLHVASANLDGNDDSAYAFRYDSDWLLIDSGTIAERDDTTAYNDAPLICVEDFIGSPFQPRDNLEGHFIQLDDDLDIIDERAFDGLPAVGGGSIVQEDDGTIIFIRAWWQDNELLIERYDDPITYDPGEWKLSEAWSPEVVDSNLTVYWPQSTIRIGDMWLTAHMARDNELAWTTDRGNVYVQVFDQDWTLLETYQVTEFEPGDGAMQPFLTWDVDTDRLLVVYDHNVQPTITEVTIDLDALGVEVVPNNPPVANAGRDQSAVLGDTVYLDGSASQDADGDPLTLTWTFASLPDGSALSVDGITQSGETAEFVPDTTGSYVVELVVDDGRDTDSDTLVVTVSDDGGGGDDGDGGASDGGSDDGGGTDSGETPVVDLVVDAGPTRSAEVGVQVVLDGSGSSSSLGGLSYAWSLVEAPQGSTLSSSDIVDASNAEARFTADVVGVYTFKLAANDGTNADEDTTTLTATDAADGTGCGCNGGVGAPLSALLLSLLPVIGLRRRRS